MMCRRLSEPTLALLILLAALLACNSEPTAEQRAEQQAAAASAKAQFGPCAEMTISSIDDAFDKAKMAECGKCCGDKVPSATSYYYHFDNNKPPGRCRCVGASKLGADCKTQDLAECLSCCSKQGKSAELTKGKGCTCK